MMFRLISRSWGYEKKYSATPSELECEHEVLVEFLTSSISLFFDG